MTPQRLLAALALVFALAHAPFLATSLEDIDSVNFALGLRHFDVADHRPHPPGYPVYIALGKVTKAVAGTLTSGAESSLDARALSVLSLLAGVVSIGLLYAVFCCLGKPKGLPPPVEWPTGGDKPLGLSGLPTGGDKPLGLSIPWHTLDVAAFSATVITVSCPLFWYLAVRPMSDLPGLAFALAAQACLLLAWRRQAPAPDGDTRLTPAVTAASGRMIVIGALLAAISIGMRSQCAWLTLPLLMLVLADRIGRGVAGALIGSAMTFTIGGLLWGIPLLVASGGLNAYLTALGAQAGGDFTSGEMLYQTPTPRVAAFALLRTFVGPWDSTPLAVAVLALAAIGLVQLAMRDRRSLAAVIALGGPYFLFHLAFQDTAFIRYALPLIPIVSFLAVRGVMLVSVPAVPVMAAVVSVWAVVIASPVLVAYGAEASPTVRVLSAMQAEARVSPPGALAMHQTFRRPLEAETIGFAPQLASPPRLEWLELEKYWREGHTEPVWFLADPVRSDLALIDPMSRRDAIEITWPLVARPAFGGMRPSSVRWYKMPAPGWFAEEGWALTPETSGMARLRGHGPELGPITAWVRRRSTATRVLVGGRNLGGPKDPSARFTLAIDDAPLPSWDAAPGFFLRAFDIPAGRLSGPGEFARLTIRSTAVTGSAIIPTSIEQFDLQAPDTTMWGYDSGWQEAEYNPASGVWRWTSDRATLRILGPPIARTVTLSIESPLKYFDTPPHVRVSAGDRELAASTVSDGVDWTFDVPADALAATGGLLTVSTDKTFVPVERGGSPDPRRLGLRIFYVHVLPKASNSLTP
ncbi:MAG: DUF2723 domain-containing protein [Vicinamibacterales bacterium]